MSRATDMEVRLPAGTTATICGIGTATVGG
jgi:hypothetical protein